MAAHTERYRVANRQSTAAARQAAVATLADHVVGYAAIERLPQEPPDSYRVFVVCDWRRANPALPEALMTHALHLLAVAHAKQAWMREVTGDLGLLALAEPPLALATAIILFTTLLYRAVTEPGLEISH